MIRFRWISRRDPGHPHRESASCYVGSKHVGGVIRFRCGDAWEPAIAEGHRTLPSRSRRWQAKRAVEVAVMILMEKTRYGLDGQLHAANEPRVKCKHCGTETSCITLEPGTTYRPLAWVFDDEANPLSGVCRGCQIFAPMPEVTGGFMSWKVVRRARGCWPLTFLRDL